MKNVASATYYKYVQHSGRDVGYRTRGPEIESFMGT